MNKYPRWAYLLAGAVLVVVALYFLGKYQAKKQAAAKANTPKAAATENVPADTKNLAGPVLRSYN